MMQPSYLNDPVITKLLIGVMVKRLGGNVTISQADIDDIAFNRLEEKGSEGRVEFQLVERKKSS